MLILLALLGGLTADTTLVHEARIRPDTVRERIATLLEREARTPGAGWTDSARALAAAYAIAWSDSTPLRSVDQFIVSSPRIRRERVRADALRRSGNGAATRDGASAAMPLWRASLRTARAAGYEIGVAAALGNIGAGYYMLEMADSARLYLHAAARTAVAIRDYRTAANALGTLGNIAKDEGDVAGAESLYAGAGRLRRLVGDTRGLAADANNLGLIAEQAGDLRRATAAYLRALSLNRAYGREHPAATNLLNLGNVASLEGRYDAAATHYGDALRIYQRLGAKPDEALTWQNLGTLSMRQGDYASAVKALSKALTITREVGEPAATVMIGLANALAGTGDVAGAHRVLLEADSAAAASPPASGAVALARADLALEFGDYAGAERDYSVASARFRAAGDPSNAAAALEGAGILMLFRGRGADANRLFTAAAATYAASGDRRATSVTGILRGHAQRAVGDTAGARQSYTSALATLTTLRDPVGQASALQGLGDLALAASLPAKAASLFHRGLTALDYHSYAPAEWRLAAGLGEARRAVGDPRGSIAAYQRAASAIEATAAGFSPGERRAAWLEDKWDVYARLAAVQREVDPGAAFTTSERMRARQLRLVAPPKPSARGLGPAFTARSLDLLNRIDRLVRQVDVVADSPRRDRGPAPAASATIRDSLAAAQRAYAQHVADSNAGSIPGDRLDPVRWPSVARLLSPRQVVLEYLVHDSTTLLFAVTSSGLATFDLRTSERELGHLIDFAREMMRASPPAERRWEAPLARLYDLLLGPAARSGLLTGKTELLIVPHAELHYLPFAALVPDKTRHGFLVDSWVISYAASASSWARELPPLRPGPVLALAPRIASLPATGREVTQISRRLGASVTVLRGARASEARLRQLAPGYAIIHFATFGVLNRHSPLFSYIDLAAGGGQDGRLEAHEIGAMPLHAGLLVLSACETSLGSGSLRDVPAGDDWVGLVSAFMGAGAGRVLASAWPVQDDATADLMDGFYAAIRDGLAPAAALARAQRTMLRDRRTESPMHWAAFMLTTSGRDPS